MGRLGRQRVTDGSKLTSANVIGVTTGEREKWLVSVSEELHHLNIFLGDNSSYLRVSLF